jgi:hypothetical protein
MIADIPLRSFPVSVMNAPPHLCAVKHRGRLAVAGKTVAPHAFSFSIYYLLDQYAILKALQMTWR